MDARNMWGRLVRQYRDQFPPLVRGGIVEDRFNGITYGKLPQIHIHEVEITGPLFDQWPTASQRAVLGKSWEPGRSSLTEVETRVSLADFASRAFRRPARAEEIDRLTNLI